MDGGNHLALTVNWWEQWRDRPPLQKALDLALRDHWYPLVCAAFKRNKSKGEKPTTFTDLATLAGINYSRLKRRVDGVHRTTAEDFRSIQRILKIPVNKLYPDNSDWLAHAVRILCPGSVDVEGSRMYADYCLEQPLSYYLRPGLVRVQCLNPQILDKLTPCWAKQWNKTVGFEEAIWKVVAELEPPLQQAFHATRG